MGELRFSKANYVLRVVAVSDMCSGSEAGSYSRRIDFVYHSTLGLRVIKKKKKRLFPSRTVAANINSRRVGK